MQKYFVNESIELNKTFEIESGDQHHIEKVMRNRSGDQIICVDLNHIQYLCTIEDVQAGIILPIEKLDINNYKFYYPFPYKDFPRTVFTAGSIFSSLATNPANPFAKTSFALST